MARARNIKPGFFKNEDLGTADPYVSLLFAGLWTLADKAGILEDRPLRIKAELFPYRDGFDINGYLTVLLSFSLIHRYEVNGLKLIQIVNFSKHQNPHHTEKPSEYISYSDTCKQEVKPPLINGGTPADSLIPDSLNTDSLIPSSLIPIVTAADKSAAVTSSYFFIPEKDEKQTDFQYACLRTWHAYGLSYFYRYGVDPVRNATVNTQVQTFVKKVGQQEAPFIAGFFVASHSQFYVQRGHTFGNLTSDAEKLRTEWATGKTMTGTRARQIDQSQANYSVVSEAMKILEGEGFRAENT
jgi:hypothetical protein